ncbi:hypothetical protein D3C72_1680250 [compost metagenome]
MSRPALTTETSSALRCTNRLPRADETPETTGLSGKSGRPTKPWLVHPAAPSGTPSTLPSGVPELTMSRPARTATAPPPSYHTPSGPVSPFSVPRYTMPPVRKPTMSPLLA